MNFSVNQIDDLQSSSKKSWTFRLPCLWHKRRVKSKSLMSVCKNESRFEGPTIGKPYVLGNLD